MVLPSSNTTLSQVATPSTGSANLPKNVDATSDFNTGGPMTITKQMLVGQSDGVAELDLSKISSNPRLLLFFLTVIIFAEVVLNSDLLPIY